MAEASKVLETGQRTSFGWGAELLRDDLGGAATDRLWQPAGG